MPVEFLSDEQVARYGGFVGDPSAYDLERFFRLDAEGSRLLKGKRRDENPGWGSLSSGRDGADATKGSRRYSLPSAADRQAAMDALELDD